VNGKNVVHIHNGFLVRYKGEWNYVVDKKMGGNGDHYVKRNKIVPQRQALHGFCHMRNLGKRKGYEVRGRLTKMWKRMRKRGGGIRKSNRGSYVIKVDFMHVWKYHTKCFAL
jgi:hypothetical protein